MEMILNGSDEMERFYQNKFYFSYSGLNKLLYSPAMFYNHYVQITYCYQNKLMKYGLFDLKFL